MNDAQRAIMASPNLGRIMDFALANHPDRTAVVQLASDASTSRQLSYRDLDRELDRIASVVIQLGLKPGDRAAVALSNSVEFVTVVFGFLRAGVVPAIVNPRLHADELAFLLEDSAVSGVIGDSVSGKALSQAGATTPIRLSVGNELDGFVSLESLRQEIETPRFHAVGDAPAMILFTSGSTGRPKGVVSSHRGQIAHFADQLDFYRHIFVKPPVTLVAAPMFHKNGTGAVKTTFITAGTLVILDRFEPRAMLKAIAQHRVTTFTGIAPMLITMLRERELLADLDLTALEAIMAGAAPTGRILLDEVEDAFGAKVHHMFGTTECGAVLGHHGGDSYTLDSCGRPLPGVTVKLVGEDGAENATEGELWVKSPGVALGYLNRPEHNSERFRDGWYATGDILSRDENGFFHFRGRVDDMFVCGGENIYPLEVERLLLKIPNVTTACVAPIAHPSKGQAPAAAITVSNTSETEETVQNAFVAFGPAYAVPRIVIILKELPIAPTGKIDRKRVSMALREEADRRSIGI
jgi:long-chain acyl-CoA synthetase